MTMKEDIESKDADGVGALEDSDLLRRYVEQGAQDAFAELVRRRIGLVYAVALRQTNGDRHRAHDATQAVFTDLARKAPALIRRPVLAGWLYRSAQFAAAGLVRAEQRRHVREQEADMMQRVSTSDPVQPDWDKVRPVLDEALGEIDEVDRDAILLRFFDGRRFADIGARLQLTENAARMRVERALDKLNAVLARRGIISTTTALGVALGQQLGVAAPAGLAATVTGTALAQAAAGPVGLIAGFFGMTKLQLALAGGIVVTGVAGYRIQEQAGDEMRSELARLREQQQRVVALQAENQQLAAAAAEVERLRGDDSELKRLAQTIAAVQKNREEAARLERQRETQRLSDQSAQTEIERMNREGSRLVGEYRALVNKSKDETTSPEARAGADAAAKLKLEEIKAKQREIQAFIVAARAGNPQFYVGTPQLRLAPSVPGQITSAAPMGEDDRISLHLPGVDQTAAFSAVEKIVGVKVARDPSLAGVTGTLTLQTDKTTKAEALQSLGQALRDQLNIVLEPNSDGTWRAKLGPAR